MSRNTEQLFSYAIFAVCLFFFYTEQLRLILHLYFCDWLFDWYLHQLNCMCFLSYIFYRQQKRDKLLDSYCSSKIWSALIKKKNYNPLKITKFNNIWYKKFAIYWRKPKLLSEVFVLSKTLYLLKTEKKEKNKHIYLLLLESDLL